MEGAGWNNEGGVTVLGGSPTLNAITFQNNQAAGIRVEASSPVITNSIFSNNKTGTGIGINLLSGAAANISYCTITGNTTGIVNASSSSSLRFNTIAANTGDALSSSGFFSLRDNAVTGQTVPARNTDGSGQTLDVRQEWWGTTAIPTGFVGLVEYDPWLGAPPTPAFAVSTFARSTTAFTPNGGGVRFDFAFPGVANWALAVTEVSSNSVYSASGTGMSGSVLWDGKNGGTAVANATYGYQLTATEAASGTPAAPLIGRVAIDSTLPISLISSPLEVPRCSPRSPRRILTGHMRISARTSMLRTTRISRQSGRA